MHHALHRSRLRFKRMRDHAQAIVQTVPDPLVVLDTDMRIHSVNAAFCRTFNVSVLQTKKRFIYSLGRGKLRSLRPVFKTLVAQHGVAQHTVVPHCEVRFQLAGQRQKTLLLNARKIRGITGSKSLLLLAFEDITERKKTQRVLEKRTQLFKREALTDSLTGLHNRRAFLTLGRHSLKITRRLGKDVSVLFLDVDGFKQINDQRGHAQGDRALIQVSDILRKTFRQSDIVSRMGGDEFAIMTIEHSPGRIHFLKDRLNDNLKDAAGLESLSLSMGVAHSRATDRTSFEQLIAKADAAMYADKRQKSNSNLNAVPLLSNVA